MKLTGQMLKERRESLKLSLSEISMQTKVNQKILKNIEEGNAAALPAKTFLRGFVQAYAIALKLDVDQVMKTFFEEMGTTTPEVAEAEDASAQVISGRTLPSSMQSSATVRILAVSGIVVLILLVFGVKSLVEKYEQESRVEPVPATLESLPAATEPAAPTTEVAKTETPADAPTDTTAATPPPAETLPTPAAAVVPPVAAPTPTPAPTVAATPPAAAPVQDKTPASTPPPVAAKPAVVEPVKAPVPVPAPVTPVVAPVVVKPAPKVETPPVVKTEPAKPTPPVATATPAATPAVVPPPVVEEKKTEPAVASAASKEIILEALDRIEVAVKVGNGAIKKIVLQPDEVYTLKGLGKISMDLSDGGAVNLIVNGQDRGVPGDLGKPKKVELP